VVAVAAAALASCGGGGGGGDGGGGGGTGPVQYSGNTSAAVITTTNAAQLTSNAVGGNDVATATSAVSPNRGSDADRGARELGRQVVRAVRGTATQSRGADGESAFTSIPIDNTEPCAGGGSVRLFGDLSPAGTGTINATYSDC
jgi:hypothetical protein